ncbi:MAG: hypothetical protein HRT68_13700 [Flavobacteriaceae bacterium]|nr:hypothetical protein [Flavobacteriaceae bacterium]
MKKKILILLALVLIGGFLGYNYIYKEHRDISSENAEFTVESSDIVKDFLDDGAAASEKYLNKTVEVSGAVSELSDKELTLNDQVYIQFDNPLKGNIEKDDQINVKARCIGFDDLLGQVKLDQATLIE